MFLVSLFRKYLYLLHLRCSLMLFIFFYLAIIFALFNSLANICYIVIAFGHWLASFFLSRRGGGMDPFL